MKKEDLVKMIAAEFPGVNYRDIHEVCFGPTRAEATVFLRNSEGKIIRSPFDREEADKVTWVGQPYEGEWP